MLVLLPGEVGYQDLAALIARLPQVADRAQKASVASRLGTIHQAKLDIPRPLGAALTPSFGYALAGLDPNSADITGSIRERVLGETGLDWARSGLPVIDRSKKSDYGAGTAVKRSVAAKGDRLAARPDADPVAGAPDEGTPAGRDLALATHPGVAGPGRRESAAARPSRSSPGRVPGEPDDRQELASADEAGQLYFGVRPLGSKLDALLPWAPGQEPRIDSEMRLAALPSPSDKISRDDALDDAPGMGIVLKGGGQTVAPKGEVTGPDRRPMSPAEWLGLDEKSRAREEKCLAEAIYFEARGEQVRGQMAVAQVVLNRAFSGKYPSTVCGVVYQNSHRRLACQFTFACDGIPDRIREPDMWERAKTIASEMLDGKLWLPEVGKATHYHAYWVRPGWVREMTRMHKLGVHTFYRPRKWGDGGEAPEWGDNEATTEAARRLVEAAKKL